MTQEDLKYLEDLMIKAVQSGKKETSDLVDTILHRIEPAIETSINKNVNGKIINLDKKIDEYIKKDEEWKASVTPSIETMKELQNFTSISSTILKTIIAFGGATAVIIGFIKWLKLP